MRQYKLRLLDERNQEMTELILYPAAYQRPIARMIQIPEARVFAMRQYQAQLLCPITSDIKSLEIQINGYPVSLTFHPKTGNIYFHDPYNGEQIFADAFGLSCLQIQFRNSEGNQSLCSEYFQVMVRPGDENVNVNAMGCFAAQNCRMLLYGTNSDYTTRAANMKKLQFSLEDKIRLLKRTTALLEKCWQVIRCSPRTDSIPASKSRKGILQRDIRQLAAHPECMAAAGGMYGIRVGSHSYIPDLHRFEGALSTTDVYENQVILAFIRSIIRDIDKLIPNVKEVMNHLPIENRSRDFCVSSSGFMGRATRMTLQSVIDDLLQARKQYSSLYIRYQEIIPASAIELNLPPAPTPVFERVEGYREVFRSILQWFDMKNVSAGDIRFVTSFLQITTLYEVYVLSKLGRFFLDQGFELTSARQVVYDLDEDSYYKNATINNVYVLEKDSVKITVYYQPVVYDQSRAERSLCGLVRNTSLSFSKGWAEQARGSYYTPDYVFKIESSEWEGSRYILADAKYTTFRNTREFKVVPLVYKYLFSLSPLNASDQISGLYVIHGKSQHPRTAKPSASSIYDLMKNGQDIFPQVEILSLYEYMGINQDDQYDFLAELFESQVNHAAGCKLNLFKTAHQDKPDNEQPGTADEDSEADAESSSLFKPQDLPLFGPFDPEQIHSDF